MRESLSDSGYGHEDIPCMTYNIHVDIFTWMCMGWFDHCMSTSVGSNPCRRLSLLGFAQPVMGPLPTPHPPLGTGQVQAVEPHLGPHM